MPDDTVDGVLAELDRVVDRAHAEGARWGYFAALYRTVTAKVKDGLASGAFDDPERMATLDAVFARRYLDALAAFESGEKPTRSWQASFEATRRWRPLILQHLLVAVNAHINLDLGIAAAQTAPGERLQSLRGDFDRINEILASLIRHVQDGIGEVSPWLGLLDRFSGRGDSEVIRFSIVVARTEAWRFATELAPLRPQQWRAPIRDRDVGVARLTRRILQPGLLSSGLLVIRSRESNDVPRVIEALARVPPPALDDVEARVRDEQDERD